MKTWLTVRIDSDGGSRLELRASEDCPDLNDSSVVHTVSAGIEVKVPPELDAILVKVLSDHGNELAQELRKQSTIHLAALSQPKGKRFEAKLTET